MNHLTLLARMRTLIATPSVTCTDPAMDQGNLAVIEHLASWAETLGFRCEIMPVAPGKANLIATLGEGSGGLVFAGHTDTVPFDGAKWQSDPFKLTERDGRLFGLGTADMKGFFPLVLEAAEAAVAAVRRGETLKAPVIILATCDEETSMAGAKALVAAGKPKARFAVIGEPTSGRPLRLQKGVMMERVIIEGRSGHSSDPSLGHNALDAMHAVIGELISYRRELATKWHNPLFTVPTPTLNLGCIHGGDNPNRICARCELQYDLRPLPGMEMDSLRADIKRRLKPLAEEYQVSISNESLFSGTPAMETPADSLLVKAVEEMTGFTAGAAAFGTEGPYFQELGMEAVIFGPGGIETAHQPDEHLEIASLQPTIDKLAALVRRFCL
ncbi:acetylornithine deacetylase [Perlucidibaca aquatica]|uniref:acetylornithine deacetylase n=1 Tax=Perlucidibaca aquatica TaxID=1852776 RepID=UPI00083AAF40|nr:acetylornithine deacetylase [Perlucidibaca aquatica]